MSILVNKDSKVLAQGITGKLGNFATERMMEYGTKVVAGITPGKGGSETMGVPIYNTVREAAMDHQIDATILFVPPAFVKEAIFEALEAEIKLIVVAVERMPVKDMMMVKQALKGTNTTLIGPNSPGIISAEECSMGYFPGDIYRKGPVGIVSRSGTFSYQVADEITRAGLGETSSLGIGGDPVTGGNFVDILKLYEEDPETRVITLIGEIGRTSEEEAAEYIQSNISKPVVAIIAGRTAPPGKTMGHAGAIITGGRGSYDSKVKALEKAGVPVAKTPKEVANLAKEALKKGKSGK
ncbi:MAG: succinate--CoA ligase subunit alpha [Dehalococcoidia bacterium]|nr:succinate--CoA ligase subunit alpha [Dehalococcoidia bacterium]